MYLHGLIGSAVARRVVINQFAGGGGALAPKRLSHNLRACPWPRWNDARLVLLTLGPHLQAHFGL